MISDADKNAILDISKRFGAGEVLLFGSAAESDSPFNDIDLGVSGIDPESFFDFYGELVMSLSKPVDLIDISKNNSFNRLIWREGIRLYVNS